MPATDQTEKHTQFAKSAFNETWTYMEMNKRTPEDDDKMLAAAYSSFYHWSFVGSPLNIQRGHWLISRAQTLLNNYNMALYHAEKCLEITLQNPDLMQDFDLPFAYESVARAHSLSGHAQQAQKLIQQALLSAENIKKPDGRSYFLKDLKGNKWGEPLPKFD